MVLEDIWKEASLTLTKKAQEHWLSSKFHEVPLKQVRRGARIQKDLHDPDNHDGVINQPEPDIQEFEVKWALGNITMNKASGGDGIPVELFQILRHDPVKVLHSICHQIWKPQQ